MCFALCFAASVIRLGYAFQLCRSIIADGNLLGVTGRFLLQAAGGMAEATATRARRRETALCPAGAYCTSRLSLSCGNCSAWDLKIALKAARHGHLKKPFGNFVQPRAAALDATTRNLKRAFLVKSSFDLSSSSPACGSRVLGPRIGSKAVKEARLLRPLNVVVGR